MNLVLPNKQPLAPDEYDRCAAEPVSKISLTVWNICLVTGRRSNFNSNKESVGINKNISRLV